MLLGMALLVLAGCSDSPEQRLAAAQDYMDQNRPELAMLEVQNLLQADSNHISALRLKAELEQRGNDVEAEIQTLQRLHGLLSGDVDVATRLGQLLTLVNDLPAAKRLIEGLRAQAPERVATLNLITAWELASGRGDAARTAAEAALLAHPGDDTAIALAVITRLLDRRFEAAQALLDVQPQGLPLWELLRIRVARAAGQLALIPPIYERLIDARPSDVRYCQELSAHYVRAEQDTAAQQVLEQCTARNPDSLDAQLLLAGFLARKDRLEAVSVLQQFLADDPANNRLRFVLAELYLAQDDQTAARKQWLAVTANDASASDHTEAQLRLARLALQADDVTEATRLIDEILAAEPNDPDGLALSAALDIESGDFSAAIEKLRRALLEQPDDAAFLTLMGRAYARSGNQSLAIDSYRSALARDPLNRQAARSLSTLLLQKRQFENIETILTRFESAQRLDDELAAALLQVRLLLNDWPAARRLARSRALTDLNPAFRDLVDGMALLSSGRAEAAISKLQPLVESGAASGSIAAALMRAYVQSGRWQAGVETLERIATQQRPNDVLDQLILKAFLDPQAGSQAAAYLDRRLQSEQPLPVHYHSRAALHARAGQLPLAQSVAREGLSAFPDAAELRLALASLLERADDLPGAIQAYREVLAREPDNAMARNNLAALLARDPTSLAEAQRLVSAFQLSRNPFFRDTWGWIEHLSGAPDRALSALQFAVDTMPEQAEFRYHLGAAALALKQHASAVEHLQKAAELLNQGQSFADSDRVAELLATARKAT